MEQLPLVSVVMPTYNRAALLARAIRNVFEQDYPRLELIIVDNGSTDGTPELLGRLASEDARIRVIHELSGGHPSIAAVLDAGVRAAAGDYIARLDDDDLWNDQQKLRKQVQFLQSHPDHLAVGGGVIVVDANGVERFRYLKAEHDSEIRRMALFANPLSHTTALFRKKEALAAGGYTPWPLAEDWGLWLSLGERGKLYNFPEYFTRYTQSERNNSFIHLRAQSRAILRIITAHRRSYPNFFAAYLFNLGQLFYSYLPFAVRSRMHILLSRLKRSISRWG